MKRKIEFIPHPVAHLYSKSLKTNPPLYEDIGLFKKLCFKYFFGFEYIKN